MKHGPRTILLKLLTILLSGSPFQWWTRQQGPAGPTRQQSQLKKLMSLARRLFKAISVKIVELAGTNQFQMFVTVSIKKKFTAVNKRIGSLAESCFTSDGGSISMAARAPGPAILFFQDHKWKQRHDPSFKLQAPSVKHHAPIFRKIKASSPKLTKVQATSFKP